MEPRKRGRPREYHRATALARAIDAFHAKGFAATSLDDLSDAMRMNRPSLYNAFGNKEALYREALAHFTAELNEVLSRLLFEEPNLERALLKFYTAAIDAYLAASPPRGCFVFCTAPVEAVSHPEIAAEMRKVLRRVDEALERRFAQARAEGSVAATVDCAAAGKLAQAVLHSIALRARARAPRAELLRIARSGVALLCAGSIARRAAQA
jgi:AcrR family transcriptional regulator